MAENWLSPAGGWEKVGFDLELGATKGRKQEGQGGCPPPWSYSTRWERVGPLFFSHTHQRTVLESQNLPHQSRVLRAGGGVSSGLLSLSLPLLRFLFPSQTFSLQSPRAETLMKTNARNQFAASSFHLAGARLCTSISTAAGGELFQSSPITHTSVLRSSYGHCWERNALKREECAT